MATITENLNTIRTSLQNIKSSIIAKGPTPSGDITTYSSAIDAIISNSQLIDRTVTHIDIPEGTTKIADYAFYQYTNLQSITIPNSVTSIGNYAFYNTSLTSVTIGNGVTSIGDYAFGKCTSLTSITIPDSVTTIGQNAFYNCIGLASVTIPNSVTKINHLAFYKCTGLTSITIGSGVTYIGGGAFESCPELKEITCKAETAPTVLNYTFGDNASNYTGRNTYDTGVNVLFVPYGSTGYDNGYWFDPLQDNTKCGFHIEHI